MSRTPSKGEGGHSREPHPVAVVDIDDIDDVDFELSEVMQPPAPVEPPTFAAGSELRRRIVHEQGEPSQLDLQLIAYLLDIDTPDDSSS